MRRPIRPLDMEDEIHESAVQAKKEFKLQLLIIVVILLFSALVFFRDPGASAFEWKDDCLLLTLPDDTRVQVGYDTISAIEYRETFDFGSPVSGGIVDRCRYGLWSNAELGGYIACCREDVPNCILFTTSTGPVVISSESAEATQALFDSAQDMLAGYLPE